MKKYPNKPKRRKGIRKEIEKQDYSFFRQNDSVLSMELNFENRGIARWDSDDHEDCFSCVFVLLEYDFCC